MQVTLKYPEVGKYKGVTWTDEPILVLIYGWILKHLPYIGTSVFGSKHHKITTKILFKYHQSN